MFKLLKDLQQEYDLIWSTTQAYQPSCCLCYLSVPSFGSSCPDGHYLRKSTTGGISLIYTRGFKSTPAGVVLNTLLLSVPGVSGIREEFKLLQDLLLEYDPAARPIKNLSDVVEVRMGVALFQIRELVSTVKCTRICSTYVLHIGLNILYLH